MKNHRLVWSLIAIVALALTLSTADTGLAKERPAKAACGAQSSRAAACPDTPLAARTKCGGASNACCRSACMTAEASCCASKCRGSSVVHGPRYRAMLRRDARCSCNKVSCRLYGQRCGKRNPNACKAAMCTAGCDRPCCAAKAVKSAKAATCKPGCEKPCCANRTMMRAKAATCKPGCEKPCCADRTMMRAKPPACRPAGERPGCAGEKVCIMSAGEADNVWVDDGEEELADDLHVVCLKSGSDDDAPKLVKKIRVERSGSDRERVIVREIGPGDEDDDTLELQSDEDGGAWLGIYLQDLTPELREAFDLPEDLEGALVTDVVRSGPARKAGVRAGFVVVEYNGNPIRTADDLVKLVGASEPGERVQLVLNRKGRDIVRRVTLGKKPQERISISGKPRVKKICLGDDGRMIDIDIPDIDIEIPEIKTERLEELGERLQELGADGAYLGVGIEDASGDEGVVVTEVYDDTPADESGIESGDVIVRIDGDDIEDASGFVEEIRSRDPGDTVTLRVERDGRGMDLDVELGERGSDLAAKILAPRMLKLERERKAGGEQVSRLKMKIKTLERELKQLKEKLDQLEEE